MPKPFSRRNRKRTLQTFDASRSNKEQEGSLKEIPLCWEKVGSYCGPVAFLCCIGFLISGSFFTPDVFRPWRHTESQHNEPAPKHAHVNLPG